MNDQPKESVSMLESIHKGFELSEVPVDCLDYPVPIPVHNIAFNGVGDSLQPSFF